MESTCFNQAISNNDKLFSWGQPEMQLVLLKTLLKDGDISKEQYNKMLALLRLPDNYGTIQNKMYGTGVQ